MALVIPTLQGQIVNALKKAQKAPSTEAGNQILATELAKAIDAYIKSGDVNTTTTGVGIVAPGQLVVTAGSPSAQAGATTSPGTSTTTGAGIGKVT